MIEHSTNNMAINFDENMLGVFAPVLALVEMENDLLAGEQSS